MRGHWTSPSIAADTRTLIEKSPVVRSLLDAQDRNQDKNTRDDMQDAVNRLIKSVAPLHAR